MLVYVAVESEENHGTRFKTNFPGVYSSNERGMAPRLHTFPPKHSYKGTCNIDHELPSSLTGARLQCNVLIP